MASFFNNLGKTISEKSKDATKKAKEMAEIVRLNGQINTEEDKLRKQYQAIGKAYFEAHKADEESVFTDNFREIEEAEAKIAQYKAEVTKLKGVGVCPNCGAEIKLGTLFCSTCGEKLYQAMDPAETEAAREPESETYTGTVEDTVSAEDETQE